MNIVSKLKMTSPLFVGLAEMSKTPCFAEHSHFGATDRYCGADHFFSSAR